MGRVHTCKYIHTDSHLVSHTCQVWLPNMHLADGSDEEKVVLVATAKCLCEFPPLKTAQPELWAALRDAAVKQAQGVLGGRFDGEDSES